ncbi:MAG: tetratricopeptide repeat protein [Cyanobacteria bacterium J06631_12]
MGKGFGHPRLADGLRRAEAYMARQEWKTAYPILRALSEAYPQEKQVWSLLTDVCLQLSKMRAYQQACERWAHIDPQNGDVLYILGFAYLFNQHPLLALSAFRRALTCELNAEQREKIEEAMPNLEELAAETKKRFEPETDDWWEISLLHERGQTQLETGDYAQARQSMEAVLRKRPTYEPARNNLSMACWMMNDGEAAIASCQTILETSPDSVHALSNLVRFLTLLGREADASPYADRLRNIEIPEAWNFWTKQVEGLSYLADDTGVVSTYDHWRKSDPPEKIFDPLFFHLTAVSLARCGRESEARRQWQKALEIRAGMAIAQKNLQEMVLPIDRQHGAWPFSLDDWLTPTASQDIRQVVALIRESRSSERIAIASQQFFDQHPEVGVLLPRLLERGGPVGQTCFVMMASYLRSPDFVAAIKAFSLGKDGTDELRQRAAAQAERADVLAQDEATTSAQPPGPKA